MQRFQSLDGWRGISILLVLAGHLFPLGPHIWQMNGAIAATGMAIFFILSGYLITSMLMKNQSIKTFIVRRFLRIVPLAWLSMVIALVMLNESLEMYLAHLFFYSNWDPIQLTSATSHLWSLCIEMQFYIFIAMIVAFANKKAFLILPVICVLITLYRVDNVMYIDIKTYFRVDEILAGCILGLINAKGTDQFKGWFCKVNPLVWFLLLLVSAHPEGGAFNYFRPYIAMLLIASTLFATHENRFNKILENRYLIYIATISYALYVIHGLLGDTWLGEGETLEKYLKRPLLIGAAFVLAHLSTFYYEKYWIDLGKRITSKSINNEQMLRKFPNRK